MDLPPGHELRDKLAAKKAELEELLDRLLGVCSKSPHSISKMPGITLSYFQSEFWITICKPGVSEYDGIHF